MDPTQTFEAVSKITVLMALVLALSFVVERILEILKAAYDVADGRYNWHVFWTRRTYSAQRYIEQRLRVFNYVDKPAAAALLARFDSMMLGTTVAQTPVVPVLCGDLVRAIWCRVALKILGIAIGVAFAFSFRLDLVYLINLTPDATEPLRIGTLGMVATGVAIGLGSGIVHKAITAIERRQQRNAEAADAR
jgi:hypothetical protein